jgi:hypothetical protein
MRAERSLPIRYPSRLPDAAIPASGNLEDNMSSVNQRLLRPIAVCLALWLMFPASESGMAAAQQPAAEHRTASAPFPDSPSAEDGTGSIVAANALPETPQPVSPPAQPQGAPDSSSQSSSSQQQPGQPVGTAAAPYEKTMGVAASRPAGAAIAPAKQKRVRTIVISVGVIVAAGVAVGSVAGLSHASSSHPQ